METTLNKLYEVFKEHDIIQLDNDGEVFEITNEETEFSLVLSIHNIESSMPVMLIAFGPLWQLKSDDEIEVANSILHEHNCNSLITKATIEDDDYLCVEGQSFYNEDSFSKVAALLHDYVLSAACDINSEMRRVLLEETDVTAEE